MKKTRKALAHKSFGNFINRLSERLADFPSGVFITLQPHRAHYHFMDPAKNFKTLENQGH
jgi:hypothetical protein